MRVFLTVLIGITALGVTPSVSAGKGEIAIHGDSTAIASRVAFAERLWNIVPGLDSSRWWNILSRSYRPQRAVFNDGTGGQSIATMRDKMEADQRHLTDTTIIYDRRNDDEAPAYYVATLGKALSKLKTDHFLIVPQIGFTPQKPEHLILEQINRAVRLRWPNNTFTQSEAAAFAAALADPRTRVDGLHRNAKGHLIEARFFKRWLDARGW